MVECSKRPSGACRRTLTGSLEIDDEAFEIKPMPDRLVSRALVVNNRNPHLLSRVIYRTGKGIPSVIVRRDRSAKDTNGHIQYTNTRQRTIPLDVSKEMYNIK
ncbi:hypothetical protein DPMN_073714 [Dreissena polymorpha]|uniref:Uncharacterized protein n=1 Tax=Dreissena polymorpha TaxID=45954 RepID=A0A9D4BZP9_DREPO|nr:hypothetical protein DPMN_073714 [Dreissena polymorpha]